MCLRVGRVDRQGPAEFPLGRYPIPVIEERDEPEGGVRLGERAVELEGPERSFLRLREILTWRPIEKRHEKAVGVGQARVCEGVVRVQTDGVLEITQGLPQIGLRTLLVEK